MALNIGRLFKLHVLGIETSLSPLFIKVIKYFKEIEMVKISVLDKTFILACHENGDVHFIINDKDIEITKKYNEIFSSSVDYIDKVWVSIIGTEVLWITQIVTEYLNIKKNRMIESVLVDNLNIKKINRDKKLLEEFLENK